MKESGATGEWNGEFNEETLKIEFNELPVYWLPSVDRCVNRSCLKCIAEVKRFEAEAEPAGENRCWSFLLHPVFARACKDKERALFLACTIPLFSRCMSSKGRKRKRRRDAGEQRGNWEKRARVSNAEMFGDRVNVQPAINRESCIRGISKNARHRDDVSLRSRNAGAFNRR